MKYYCEDTGETADNYPEYLETDHWKLLRMKVFADRKGICEICGLHMVRGFQAHHKTYERVGHENIEDLMLLCNRCHRNQHPEKQEEKEKSEPLPTSKSVLIRMITGNCNNLTNEQLKKVLQSVKLLGKQNKQKKKTKKQQWKRKKGCN
jgi:hypothetical protein